MIQHILKPQKNPDAHRLGSGASRASDSDVPERPLGVSDLRPGEAPARTPDIFDYDPDRSQRFLWRHRLAEPIDVRSKLLGRHHLQLPAHKLRRAGSLRL